ncbi:MAG: LCP family protein [Candidatus Pacebacteria bacterium]|nr:LCP family protein [Candidatus Paceibacterota bacterium]
MGKTIGYLAAGIVFFFFVVFSVIGYRAFRWYAVLQSSGGPQWSEGVSAVQKGWKMEPLATHDTKTVLVLGVDAIKDRSEGKNNTAILTDSMMVLSYNLKTNTLTQFSLPRDIWIDAYKTKINALYHYGFDRYPDNPTQFPQEVLQVLLGIPIHHVVVLKLSTVAEIIDSLGGIDVEIDRGFTDELFPRSGVDVATVRDPAVLYETIQFKKGVEHMSGDRALKYIRSRHSNDLLEGTDDARVARQQKVIQAVMTAVMNRKTLLNPRVIGKLYAVYAREFQQAIPLEEGVSVLHSLIRSNMQTKTLPQPLKLTKYALSIREQEKPGVLYHPFNRQGSTTYGNQWVYLPIDPSWKGVQSEVRGFYAKE